MAGDGNRLRASAYERFTYDGRDRMASRAHRDGLVVRYVYDSFDMLVQMERVDATGAADAPWEASYDAIGRRISTQQGGERREFYWDGDRLGAEIFPDGHVRVYQYASRQALVPLGFTEYESLQADPATGRTYHVFSDPVGMPLFIEDDKGMVVWSARRVDPYGVIEVERDAKLEYNLRWPGHYYDAATGLHCNRYRYYDPRLGRFLQMDPLGYGGSPVNLYAYCANPLVQIDVLGLCENSRAREPAAPQHDGRERRPKVAEHDVFRRQAGRPIDVDALLDRGVLTVSGNPPHFAAKAIADLRQIAETPTGRRILSQIEDSGKKVSIWSKEDAKARGHDVNRFGGCAFPESNAASLRTSSAPDGPFDRVVWVKKRRQGRI